MKSPASAKLACPRPLTRKQKNQLKPFLFIRLQLNSFSLPWIESKSQGLHQTRKSAEKCGMCLFSWPSPALFLFLWPCMSIIVFPSQGLGRHCSLVSLPLAFASKLHQTNLHFKVVSSCVQLSRALVALRSTDLILKWFIIAICANIIINHQFT